MKHSPCPAQRGFTLLEVLLVAVLLGVVASAVVYNYAPQQNRHQAQDAAVVFSQKMQYARQTALVRNWVLGLEVDDISYRFYRWHNARWQLLTEPPLQEAMVPEAVTLELLPGEYALLDNIVDSEERSIFRPDERDTNNNREPPQPTIFIFESTDFVPFTLAFHASYGGFPHWVDARDGLNLQLSAEEP